MKLLFLSSGNGGNMKFIYHANNMLNLGIEMVGVISDRKCKANRFAEENNIYTDTIAYTKKSQAELNAKLVELKPDIVITNIHKVLTKQTLTCVDNCRFINLHYSLLPSFKGTINMAAVQMAKESNSQFIGVSSHEVIEEVDSGRLISQGIFHPNWNENIELIYDTIFKTGNIVLLNSLFKKGANKDFYATKKVVINGYEVIFSEGIFEIMESLGRIWEKIQVA